MALFLPRRWTRQPQGPVEVDWGNPLLDKALYLTGGFDNPVKQDLLGNEVDDSTYYGPSSGHFISRFGSVEARRQYDTVFNPEELNTADPTTTFILANVYSTDNPDAWLTLDVAERDWNDAGFDLFVSRNDTANSGVNFYTSGWMTYDTITFYAKLGLRMIVVTRNQSKVRAYVDGALVGGSDSITKSNLISGSVGSLFWISANKGIPLAGLFKREMCQSEVEFFSRNPFQLLKPRRPILYSFPSGGITIPTLSLPGVQDITATGARPKVTLTF